MNAHGIEPHSGFPLFVLFAPPTGLSGLFMFDPPADREAKVYSAEYLLQHLKIKTSLSVCQKVTKWPKTNLSASYLREDSM